MDNINIMEYRKRLHNMTTEEAIGILEYLSKFSNRTCECEQVAIKEVIRKIRRYEKDVIELNELANNL